MTSPIDPTVDSRNRWRIPYDDKILSVKCETCGSLPGRKCMQESGWRHARFPHSVRTRSVYALEHVTSRAGHQRMHSVEDGIETLPLEKVKAPAAGELLSPEKLSLLRRKS